MTRPGAANPYPGPRPFEADEQDIFFGRDAEIRELVTLVLAHHAVLLYAASGSGKTSLLNAGVIPGLRQEAFEVLPTLRIRATGDGAAASSAQNVYTGAVLANLAEALEEELPSCDSLADAFAREEKEEEEEGEEPALRVLIFDQFEELFTTYPEAWRQREDFLAEIAELLVRDERQRLRIVVAIREDYLAEVDSYPKLARALRVRMRLEPLEEKAALQAVKEPLEGTGRSFAPGVAEKLVGDLLEQRIVRSDSASSNGTAVGRLRRLLRLRRRKPPPFEEIKGKFVEPVQLQVVCRGLWAALPAEVAEITHEHLRLYGDVDQALARFYEDALHAAKGTRIRERKLRSRIQETFITPGGTRALVYRGEKSVGGIPIAAIMALERTRLIRGLTYSGAPHLELTHDSLIDPIRASNERSTRTRQRRIAAGTVSVSLAVAVAAVVGLLAVSQDEATSAPSVGLSADRRNVGPRGELAQTITYTNPGPTPATLTGFATSSPDFQVSSSCRTPVKLAPMTSCMFTVISLVGREQHAVLRIMLKDRPEVRIRLRGSGSGAAASR